jgi:hypothetical protein
MQSKLCTKVPTFFFQNIHIEKRVLKPLQRLLETFHGPTRLIQKRQDKHIDFSACTQRSEKNKDPSKIKMVSHYLLTWNLIQFSFPPSIIATR